MPPSRLEGKWDIMHVVKWLSDTLEKNFYGILGKKKEKKNHKMPILEEIGNMTIRQSDPSFISKMNICKHSQEREEKKRLGEKYGQLFRVFISEVVNLGIVSVFFFRRLYVFQIYKDKRRQFAFDYNEYL